ncbi:hypothetical protein Adt_37825 [Abeliophyllum distichum]|uniref:Uncharacterized protein n=1 Tax=Abeliophyllum distichum TaxID=126358 RepID=A0ABD1Q3D7_9LAMI
MALQNFFKFYKINGRSSCGAVFARWLVSLHNDEGGKRREIELVAGGEDEEEMRTDLKEGMSMKSSIRYVLEDIEIKDNKIEEEVGRMSICIPPKNALLLMRCIFDPMKMAALANLFSWDANAASKQEDADEGGEILINRLRILNNNCTYKNVKLQMK